MDLNYLRRRFSNFLALGLSTIAMAFGIFWLGWILVTLFQHGYSALSHTLFTEMTPPPGNQGGLLNAIYGSLLMTGVGTLIGTPIGILAGTYLSEYGQGNPLASVIRFVNKY